MGIRNIIPLFFFVNCLIAQNNKEKEILFFNHKEFKIKYPKKWNSFETNFFEKDVVLRLAKKEEIEKVFIIPGRKDKKGGYIDARIIPYEHDKEKIEEEFLEYLKDSTYLTSFAENQFNLSIEAFKDKKLSKFIKKRKKRIKQTDYVKGTIKKISDTHYVNELMIFNDKNNADSPSKDQIHLMHYYYHNEKLYTLVYTHRKEIDKKTLKEVDLIFNSFEFIQK